MQKASLSLTIISLLYAKELGAQNVLGIIGDNRSTVEYVILHNKN
jgi:hypothetical protein